MDGELTAIPSSTVRLSGGEGSDTDTPDSCREIFDKAFPQYLALGMTYDEFYRQDHTLVIAYRKAHELKRKEENENFWLMGAYVYQAICRVSPLLAPFAKSPKAEDYLKEPFPIFGETGTDEEAKAKAVSDKGLAYMFSQMEKINRRFGYKE